MPICLWIIFSLITCNLTTEGGEESIREKQGHSTSGHCIGMRRKARNRHWALAGLHNSNLADSGHINPSISADAATE